MKSLSVDEKIRAEFLFKGKILMEKELEQEVDYVIRLRDEYPLSNTDILTDNIIMNKDLPSQIKCNIREYCENVKKIIHATTYFIEENKFNSVEDAISKTELSKFEKDRILNLLQSQKMINYSFQTLRVTIELFSKINENILIKIKNECHSQDKIGQSKLYLKNAILVYELTNFLVNYIETFGLLGVNELRAIREDVFNDIEKNKRDDEELTNRLFQVSNEMRDSIMKDINNRKQIRELIKKKWNEFDTKIDSLNKGVASAINFLSELKVIRDNAKNQISVLQIIATIQVLEKNFEIARGLTFMNKISLAPLTPVDACNLLGISIMN